MQFNEITHTLWTMTTARYAFSFAATEFSYKKFRAVYELPQEHASGVLLSRNRGSNGARTRTLTIDNGNLVIDM